MLTFKESLKEKVFRCYSPSFKVHSNANPSFVIDNKSSVTLSVYVCMFMLVFVPAFVYRYYSHTIVVELNARCSLFVC